MVEGDDEQRRRPDDTLRHAMSSVQQPSDAAALRAAVALFRPQAPALVARIAERIQSDVDRYSGPVTGRRHQLITLAVKAAVNHFLEMIEHGPKPALRVDDLFRRMGYGEAMEGRDLQAMHASFRIATRDAWNEMRSAAERADLSAASLGAVGDALFAFMDHLTEQTSIGFETGRGALDRDPDVAREQLLAALLERRPHTEVRAASMKAAWPLPERLVVVCVQPDPALAFDLQAVAPHALVADHGDTWVAVCSPDRTDEVLRGVIDSSQLARSAVSWPVLPAEVPDALRWAQRGLALREQGVIADQPVVDCLEHRTLLWLHAEPALRRRMCQDMLQPLLAETPNSREILSETLLVWLETRDSAPAIAAQLGVHPQTVRYRWKRINELFGDDLRDPETIVQLTMLLKASVPLWKTGDQSDFERYRTGEPS